ncbi:TetR/AcrR family transcriptional regulator [Nocardia aurantiaca]|uniref:TetR family transcriptional regulator n=1 Tax=Nocardia aurantiaca TaxID=2675850 RepID=A0A6I3KXV1_9NOCA|nr:TetR/AcrR family transcriptional regulator [Nocardia aurantiaca]MTE13390.1 TetR family transcriptional regulator [Nocardia aurantiaca]
MTTSGTAPAKGTRPRNRRALIIAAAGELFYRDGYAATSMNAIADAVAIRPSALYRHFRSKQDLLAAVVVEASQAVREQLNSTAADDLATTVGHAAVAHRTVGVILQRESRYLSLNSQSEVGDVVRTVRGRIADLIRIEHRHATPDQADFLATCVLAVMTSISYQSVQMPDERLARLIADLVSAVTATEFSDTTGAVPPSKPPRLTETSRRSAILTTSSELFAREGFSNVSIEDIGRAVGIAGPSVYNHFTGKIEILEAAFVRGNEWLRLDMNRALAEATGHEDALRQLLGGYIDFALDWPAFAHLLLTEVVELPEDTRHRIRVMQRDYINEWVHLLRSLRPRLDATSARIRVQATIHIANQIALTPHLQQASDSRARLLAVGSNTIGIRSASM